MNIKTVQYLMGHASAEVTLDVYSHITFEEAQQRLRGFDKICEVMRTKGKSATFNNILTVN